MISPTAPTPTFTSALFSSYNNNYNMYYYYYNYYYCNNYNSCPL